MKNEIQIKIKKGSRTEGGFLEGTPMINVPCNVYTIYNNGEYYGECNAAKEIEPMIKRMLDPQYQNWFTSAYD